VTQIRLEANIPIWLDLLTQTQMATNRNGLWWLKWSRDQWRHVTMKGQIGYPNTLRAQYLENSYRYYLATIANY